MGRRKKYIPTHQGRTPSKAVIMAYVQNFTLEAVDKIVYAMRSSPDEKTQILCAKIIVDKSLPDAKQLDIGVQGDGIKFNIIAGADYLSAVGKLTATSEAGATYGSGEIQGIDLAQTGEEDNDSNQSDSQVVTA